MATQKTAPGVYIEEQQQSPMIIGVGTSTAGFVGWAASQNMVNEAHLITNFGEYISRYGLSEQDKETKTETLTVFSDKSTLPYSVYTFFQRGGTQCYIVNINGAASEAGGTAGDDQPAELPSVTFNKGTTTFLTVTAKKAGTGNATITLADSTNTSAGGTLFNIQVEVENKQPITYEDVGFEKQPVKTLLLSDINNPDVEISSDQVANLPKSLLGTSQTVENPVPPPKPKPAPAQSGMTFSNSALDAGLLIGTEEAQTGLHAFDVIEDVNLILIPDLCLLDADKQAGACKQVLDYCSGRNDCFFVGDIPGAETDYNAAIKFVNGDTNTLINSLGYGAFYYPWIQINNPQAAYPSLPPLFIPPSGAVAGAYAATDASRGVFKSAAGTVDGLLNLAIVESVKTTQVQLGLLNKNCVNDIRSLSGKGVCIWGARTNAGEASEWKYVSVRRLFIFVEQSIRKSSDWIVFEPNTPKLWGTIIRNLTVFLTSLWREGALFGASAEEAFFIKVDAENNPPIERRKGNLVIEIGLAPVFPAEFVIIKIGQKVLPAE